MTDLHTVAEETAHALQQSPHAGLWGSFSQHAGLTAPLGPIEQDAQAATANVVGGKPATVNVATGDTAIARSPKPDVDPKLIESDPHEKKRQTSLDDDRNYVSNLPDTQLDRQLSTPISDLKVSKSPAPEEKTLGEKGPPKTNGPNLLQHVENVDADTTSPKDTSDTNDLPDVQGPTVRNGPKDVETPQDVTRPQDPSRKGLVEYKPLGRDPDPKVLWKNIKRGGQLLKQVVLDTGDFYFEKVPECVENHPNKLMPSPIRYAGCAIVESIKEQRKENEEMQRRGYLPSVMPPIGPKLRLGRTSGLSSRASRREAMRRVGVPTSQQPKSQSSVRGPGNKPAGRELVYDAPRGEVRVQHQLQDRNHGPHWEAGKTKPGGQKDPAGRPRLRNDKVRVE